jgi:uncharacterized protein (DUF433 family)/DNA-binding transcriptional MerR regulator
MGDLIRMGAPRGHYLASEVGALAGVSGDRIVQWARRGYIRASWSEPGESPLVYSFQDVAEAMLVHELEDRGVPLSLIRATVKGLRERYGNWPLQAAELEVDQAVSDEGLPLATLAVVEDKQLRMEASKHGWQILEDVRVNPRRISLDLHRGGWAVRVAPDLEHIEVDPDRLSGRPVIRGRRVPVSLVAEEAGTPDGLELLHDDYGLTDDEIADAKRWTEITHSFLLAA